MAVLAGATGAANLDTFTINALGGDVTVKSASFLSGATSIDTNFNITMGSTAVAVNIGDLTISEIATAATASEQSVKITLAGTGSFTLGSANIATARLTLGINATALASGSNVTIDLTNVNASAAISAVFGANTGSYLGGAGGDNVEFGAGVMTVDGGLGNDTLTMSTAVNNVHQTVDTIAGADTVIGAAAGDIILFGGAMTAATGTYLGSAWNTGTATTTAQILTAALSAAATAAGTTAIKQLSIYTAAGDTIIEVLGTTATVSANTGTFTAGVSGAGIVRIVLSNKDYTAITAAFNVNSTGSGLSVTLL